MVKKRKGTQQQISHPQTTLEKSRLAEEVGEEPIEGVEEEPMEGVEEDSVEEESTEEVEDNNLETSFTAADSITTSGHSRLVSALESPAKFIQLIDSHKSKKDEFDLEEVIPILTSDEQNAMWSRLSNFVGKACQPLDGHFLPGHNLELGEQSDSLLSGVALVCRLSLDIEEVIAEPSTYLKETIHMFSNHILHVKPQIGDAFSRCIESWYTSSLDERDELAVNSVKFLLKKTLIEKNGTKSDVKRIWSLHQILLSVRLDECGFKDDLLNCFSSPLYLTTQPEGVKFLVLLNTLSVPFVQEIYKQIRQSLISLSSKQAYTLGEVYMKAWSQSGGLFKETLNDNLQKLMDQGMLVNRSKYPVLAKNIASFLHCFHENKQNSELKSLLANLYSPFIWRYIKCSNQNVRLNALHIFLSAYPVEDMNLSKQERETEIDKQNTLLKSLLMDEVQEIRCTTITGLGNILANYWLLLSSETINSFMEPMIKELSFESVTRVRVKVYQCMKRLLDTSYSHIYMKEILPKLKMGLHDTNESVRIAFLDLLIAVKNIKIIRYWDICALENLLAQMEVDKPVVSRAIAKLLIPSIFPKDGSTEELLDRAIKLHQTNKKAARKFYFIVPDIIDTERLLQLVYGIIDSVRNYLKSKKSDKENQGGRKDGKKKKLYDKSVLDDSVDQLDSTSVSSLASSVAAPENPAEEEHVYADMELVGGMLDSVCILWYNLQQKLAEECNIKFRLYLEQKVAKSILKFFKHYRDTSISSTIVYLASFLSHSSATHVASYSLSQLKRSEKFQIHAEALVNWRRGDEVLELLVEWVRGEVDTPTPRTNHGVQFREPDTEKPSLQKIMDLAHFILDNETTRMILLKKNYQQLIEFSQTTGQVLQVIQDKLGGGGEVPEKRIQDLVKILNLHLKLSVILGIHRKDLIEKLEDLVSWVDVQLVSVVVREQDCTPSGQRLAEKCVQELLFILEGVLLTGQVDEKFVKRVLDFNLQIIPNLNLADCILDIQREIANTCFNKQYIDLYEGEVPVNFVNLLKLYSQQGEKLETSQSQAIKSKILKFIRLYQKISKLDASTTDSLEDLVETVCLAMFQSANVELDKTESAVFMDRLQDIDQANPTVQVLRSRTVLDFYSILQENPTFTKVFHSVLSESIPEKEYKTLFIYLCLSGSMTIQVRAKFLDGINSRVENLRNSELDEPQDYEEECDQAFNLLNIQTE